MTKAEEQPIKSSGRLAVYMIFGLGTIGAALGNLSQTGVNAMLPSVMLEFGLAVDVGQWLTTAYMLVMGVAVPIATYLINRLDNRRYLLLGFGLFAAGSFMDMVAPGFFTMLLGRILQAISVALLVPKMQTVAMTQFAPGRRATAMGVAGIALGFAPNVGPTIGGAMDYAFGWRSFFVLLFVLSALLAVATLIAVRRSPLPGGPAGFETVSFVFSTLGFGGVLLGLSQASTYGLASPWVWVPVAVGIVFLVLFVLRQRKVPDPLMDLRIFQSRTFNGGLLAGVFLFASFMGVTLVIPLYVVGAQGGTSLDAGLVILPTTITALVVNPLSGFMSDKTSPKLTTRMFGSFLAVGSVACVFVTADTPLWVLSVLNTVRGIGVSGLIGPLLAFSLSGLEGPLVAHGSSAQVVIRQVAATFGTAMMVFCVSALVPLVGEGAISPAAPYQAAFAFSAVMALTSFAFVLARVK